MTLGVVRGCNTFWTISLTTSCRIPQPTIRYLHFPIPNTPMPPLTQLSATELARLICHREVSAKEVTEAHIKRIEEVNPRINAVAFPMFEEARRTAEAADAAQARGEDLGLLHG